MRKGEMNMVRAYPQCIGNRHFNFVCDECPWRETCFNKTYMIFIPNSIANQAKMLEEILPREPSLFVLKCWRKKRNV